MMLNENSTDPQHREALVSMTALYFIEEHALLRPELLEDAKKSLQALFLRTSGEETMLRKLIEILKTTKQIHQSFASISNVLSGITRGAQTVGSKVAAYKQALATMSLSAEENAAFAGPFLSFSQTLLNKIDAFDSNMRQYVEFKETEARYASIYRIAMDARERLKQRLAGVLGSQTRSDVETRIRQNVVNSFDYSEAETNLQFAQRDARNKEEEIMAQLEDIRVMCQMARNPAMRNKMDDSSSPTITSYSVIPATNTPKQKADYDDVFAMFSKALRQYPRLLQIKDIVLELFRLYQNSYGMFRLDCDRLSRAMETMFDNSEAYFETKEEDKDIRIKREKLMMIEGLIPFLEHAAILTTENVSENYSRFSRRLSSLISEKKTVWVNVSEYLLRAKVQAEAELSTRL
jgi:tetratricopeptide (TPR) repeat protein